MARKTYTHAQIVMKLREADRLLGEGFSVAESCRRLKISPVTLGRWRERFGGKTVAQVAEVAELRLENERLKRIVAEKELELAIMREVALGKI